MMSVSQKCEQIAAVCISAIAVFTVMGMVIPLPAETRNALLRESGAFESLSALGYGICLLLLALLWPHHAVMKRWYLTVVLTLFAARELDLDKSVFTEGLLNSRQYIGDSVNLPERVFSLLLLTLIIITLSTLVSREARRFLRSLSALRPAAFAVAIGLSFIIAYKAIDGLGRKLAPFGVDLRDDQRAILRVVEEVGECGIPLMFALAILITATSTYRDASASCSAKNAAPGNRI